MILSAEHIAKAYLGKVLLQDASLFVEKGDRIGILGPNGAGKSTLLKMLAGLERPDARRVPPAGAGARISYLPQNPEFPKGATVVAGLVLLRRLAQGAGAAQPMRPCGSPDAPGVCGRERARGHPLRRAEEKLALAAALIRPCEALLLDEPTNHLDTETAEWLEKQLAAFSGALLLVTHDRYFLERVANQIVELEGGALYTHPANYSAYLERKAEREDMARASERKRQAILKKELAWMQRGARARSTKAKGRIERFEQLSAVEGPKEREEVRLHAASSRLGRKIIEIEGLTKGFDGRTLLRDFSYVLLRDDRVGIVGPNGCGKSTLLHLIEGSLAPDAGTIVRGDTVRLGCFSQDNAALPHGRARHRRGQGRGPCGRDGRGPAHRHADDGALPLPCGLAVHARRTPLRRGKAAVAAADRAHGRAERAPAGRAHERPGRADADDPGGLSGRLCRRGRRRLPRPLLPGPHRPAHLRLRGGGPHPPVPRRVQRLRPPARGGCARAGEARAEEGRAPTREAGEEGQVLPSASRRSSRPSTRTSSARRPPCAASRRRWRPPRRTTSSCSA